MILNPSNPNDVEARDVTFSPSGTDLKSTDIQGAIEELFTSVSNGKELIASAITDKGVPTDKDAAFETMAENIYKLKKLTEGGNAV